MDGSDHNMVQPSTSSRPNKGKRKLGPQATSPNQSPASKQPRSAVLESNSEEAILSEVKKIMKNINGSLKEENNTFHDFLRTKISDLETDKRELVGVFGKTGAGKSYLINAIIGEKNLLPSGLLSACTSVMVKLEANMQNLKYEAEIEFITKEEWEEELKYAFAENTDEEKEDDDDYEETVEKISAVYGEEWRNMSPENLMNKKHFGEIREFLNSERKVLKCKSAKELNAKIVKYTRTESEEDETTGPQRWYWPLVKCVTVRVPNYEHQYVTLVDLPGNGDRNKSRDRMWRGVVGRCSTVWIVTDITRAASEEESWEILKSASSLMGNGGECQQIHFICTKSDITEDLSDNSAVERIRTKNIKAKKAVKKAFDKQNKIKKHFSDNCLEVFTVSAKEFLEGKRLEPNDTEIPKLQEFLKDLNDSHSETLNYVSGARGILSLIQGARSREMVAKKTEVCAELEKNLKELDKVRKHMEEAYKVFEERLEEGVQESERSCEELLKTAIDPEDTSGRGFHRILKCVVERDGVYKPKKGNKENKEINLNVLLASRLTDSIDEEFRKTFPNDRKDEPFNGVISKFSLGTDELIGKYKDVQLQLIFLKTEEEKMKTKLNKIIRERKKTIYSSLTDTMEDNMQECYSKAAGITGPDSLKNMRETLKKHVCDSKNIMFVQAKDAMLEQLKKLMEDIMKEMEETLRQSIELSLKTDDCSIPDVSADLEKVRSCYDQVKGSPAPEISN